MLISNPSADWLTCAPAAQYKGMFRECLDRAAEELRAGGHAGDLPDSGQLAARIEAAFHKHYGAALAALPHTQWCTSHGVRL